MSSLEQLIRYESANSCLAFRTAVYGADDDAGIVMDCLALANADVRANRRFIFLGVDDSKPGRNRLVGIDKQQLAAFKQRFLALLAEAVEPKLAAAVRSVEVDDRLIGIIRIKNCVQKPYLTCRQIAPDLPAGVGLIRRGVNQMPLMRSDLGRMFSASGMQQPAPPVVTIRFAGAESDRIEIPVLSLEKLPSELAAERIRALLEARSQSRDILGQTQSRLSRLMHARLYGVDAPFEEHSDNSLHQWLDNVDADYQSADDHYRNEVRAHRINLWIQNNSESVLSNVVLELTVSRLPGLGIADRIHAESEDAPGRSGYPRVIEREHTISVLAEPGMLFPGRQQQAFGEPLRICAREEAGGSSAAVEYCLSADELPEPVQGNLVISVGRPRQTDH